MHKIAASKFRLGFSTTWNLIYSPLYFFYAFRMNLVLNTYIRCMLSFFRIKLVKWFMNVEARYIKLGIIVFSASKGTFSKIRKKKGKKKRIQSIFPRWNYVFVNKYTWYLNSLYKYCMRKNHNKKVKWTTWFFHGAPLTRKFFPALFYRLGKNRSKFKRKLGKWNRSFENILTLERDLDLIKKKKTTKLLKKFSKFPPLQFQYFLSFKVYLLFMKLSKSFFFDRASLFRVKIFSFITLINLFIKKFTSSKKNRRVSNLLNWFKGKNIKFKKPRIRRYIIPKIRKFFDYFSKIRGLSDESLRNRGKFGSISRIRIKKLHKLNVPWSAFFIDGFYMPYSYKRYLRKIFFHSEKSTGSLFIFKKDKILLTDYLIKYLLFDKLQISNHSKITMNSFFFNRKGAVSKLINLKKLLLKSFDDFRHKDRLNRKLYEDVKMQRKLLIFNKLNKSFFSRLLGSNKLHWVWDNVDWFKKSRDLHFFKSFLKKYKKPFTTKIKLIKAKNLIYPEKINKFLLVKFFKNTIKQMVFKNIAIFKRQIYEKNLVTGSKNLERYIEFFKVQKFFNWVYKLVFIENPQNFSGEVLFKNKYFFFMLKNFVNFTKYKLFSKFLIQLFLKLLKFNFSFFIYKNFLAKTNDTNVFNYADLYRFNKKNIGSSKLKNNKNDILSKMYKNKYILSLGNKDASLSISKKCFNFVFVVMKLVLIHKLQLQNLWHLNFEQLYLKEKFSVFFLHLLKIKYFNFNSLLTILRHRLPSLSSTIWNKRRKWLKKQSRIRYNYFSYENFFHLIYFNNIKKFTWKLNLFYLKKFLLRFKFNKKKQEMSWFYVSKSIANNSLLAKWIMRQFLKLDLRNIRNPVVFNFFRHKFFSHLAFSKKRNKSLLLARANQLIYKKLSEQIAIKLDTAYVTNNKSFTVIENTSYLIDSLNTQIKNVLANTTELETQLKEAQSIQHDELDKHLKNNKISFSLRNHLNKKSKANSIKINQLDNQIVKNQLKLKQLYKQLNNNKIGINSLKSRLYNKLIENRQMKNIQLELSSTLTSLVKDNHYESNESNNALYSLNFKQKESRYNHRYKSEISTVINTSKLKSFLYNYYNKDYRDSFFNFKSLFKFNVTKNFLFYKNYQKASLLEKKTKLRSYLLALRFLKKKKYFFLSHFLFFVKAYLRNYANKFKYFKLIRYAVSKNIKKYRKLKTFFKFALYDYDIKGRKKYRKKLIRRDNKRKNWFERQFEGYNNYAKDKKLSLDLLISKRLAYYKTDNAKKPRYSFIENHTKHYRMAISQEKFKFVKQKIKKKVYKFKSRVIDWAGLVTRNNYWVFSRYTKPIMYKSVYYQIKRVENKVEKQKQELSKLAKKSKDGKWVQDNYYNNLRLAVNNSKKIFRNLGKYLLMRKNYLNFMFKHDWFRNKKDFNPLWKTTYNSKGYILFLPKGRYKGINWGLKINYSKQGFNLNKLEFYKNKYVLGDSCTQSVRSRWDLFNSYLKKKVVSDFKNSFFNLDYFFYFKGSAYKFLLNKFSKIYYRKRGLLSWKIKKNLFFKKLVGRFSKYRLVKKKPRRRRGKKRNKKSRLRGNVLLNKNNVFILKPTMSMHSRRLTNVYNRVLSKIKSIHRYLIGAKVGMSQHKNLIDYYMKRFPKLIKHSYRDGILTLRQKRDISKIKNPTIFLYKPFKTFFTRKISWFKYWLFFARFLNIHRKLLSYNNSLRNLSYQKSSISFKLFILKVLKHQIFSFLKFKFFRQLEDTYLGLTRFMGVYMLKFFPINLENFKVSILDFSLSKSYFKLNNLSNILSSKIIINYINLLLQFEMGPVHKEVNIRESNIIFFSDVKNQLKFNIFYLKFFVKSFLYTSFKVKKILSFSLQINRLYDKSKFDLSSVALKSVGKFNVLNESRFLKFIFLEIDFSLFNTMSYETSLNRVDFTVAISAITSNNLTKFFKSTKLVKNVLFLRSYLKRYKIWLLKNLLCQDLKINFLRKKELFPLSLENRLSKFVLSFVTNFTLNFSIISWKRYKLSRKPYQFFKYWLKRNKFLFWLTQEFERDTGKLTDIYFINSITALSKTKFNKKFYEFVQRRKSIPSIKLMTKRIKTSVGIRRRFKWRNFIALNDILFSILIAMKYHSVSFFAENMALQLYRRKKHWWYIHTIKRLITWSFSKVYFKRGIGELHTLRVSVNGKINGKDRSINYLFFKKVKDKQIPRVHQLYLYVNYGFREVVSKYGVFAIRVWFSRV